MQTHCFQASEAFNKQQWMNCIRQAKEAAGRAGPGGRGQEGGGGGEEEGCDGETGGGQAGLLPCSSPCEEEEVMEAEPPGGEELDEGGMDTSDITSLQGEGLTRPC